VLDATAATATLGRSAGVCLNAVQLAQPVGREARLNSQLG